MTLLFIWRSSTVLKMWDSEPYQSISQKKRTPAQVSITANEKSISQVLSGSPRDVSHMLILWTPKRGPMNALHLQISFDRDTTFQTVAMDSGMPLLIACQGVKS